MTSAFTAMLARSSPTGSHFAPADSDFQIPPETPPVYMTCGCTGSTTKTRVRPPMLPGPRKRHLPRAEGSGVVESSSLRVVEESVVEESLVDLTTRRLDDSLSTPSTVEYAGRARIASRAAE